jgi:outer membrane protein TolC
MWWIALAVVLVGLVLLAVSVFVTAGRVRPLRRAVRRLRIRVDQAQRLQRRGLALRSSAEQLRAKVAEAAAKAERLRS